MASLIKILAASVGGGIVLGAGIRLGEAIATQLPPAGEAGDKLTRRLDQLEHRLTSLETSPGGSPQLAAEPPERVREELREWLETNVSTRMADVETRLKTENLRVHKEILDAFSESVETRVIQRISRLEDEVASQSAAMTELRECSLRTEHSVHKLLGGLDKLIPKNPTPAPEEKATPPNPEPGPVVAARPEAPEQPPAQKAAAAVDPPASLSESPGRRRWKLFG